MGGRRHVAYTSESGDEPPRRRRWAPRRDTLSLPTRVCAAACPRTRASSQQVTGQREQIACEHRGHDATRERFSSFPSAAVETECVFQKPDQPLDTGPEVTQAPAYPCAARHVVNRQAALLRECDIEIPSAFPSAGLSFEAKPPSLVRSSEDPSLQSQKRHDHGGFRRVALGNHAVRDESGLRCLSLGGSGLEGNEVGHCVSDSRVGK